jgi:hypothetical protein
MRLTVRIARLEAVVTKRNLSREPDYDLSVLSLEEIKFLATAIGALEAAGVENDPDLAASVIGPDAAERLFTLLGQCRRQ